MKSKQLCAFVIALLMTCALFFSCNSKIDTKSTVHTSKVINSFGLGEYGQFIYSGSSIILKFNRNTGEMIKACADPECDGKCELESGLVRVIQIYDGKMFFWSYPSKARSSIIYGWQDIITGEVKILVNLNEDEGDGKGAFVYDGFIYYTRTALKDGADPSETDSYSGFMCRTPINGGKEERLREAENESFAMVADGFFITFQGDRLISYDKSFSVPKVLFSCEEAGYKSFVSTCQYYDGNLYFICSSDGSYLVSLNLGTGSFRKVTDYEIQSFCLTESGIYVTPYVLKVIDTDDFNNPVYSTYSSLNFLSFDGSSDKTVYTNDKLNFGLEFTVIDNTLFGWAQDFDEEAHRWGEKFFLSINLNNGKATPAITVN